MAEAHCMGLGGHLVSVQSPEEHKFVAVYMGAWTLLKRSGCGQTQHIWVYLLEGRGAE